MFFQDSDYALTWLDCHSACQKDIFINDRGQVFIGDWEDLMSYGEDGRDWDHASTSDLVNNTYDHERC